MPDRVGVVRGGLVYVEKEGLPPAMLNRLLRLAALQNPEFHKAQAARLPTFGNLVAALDGKKPPSLVNPDVWKRGA